MPCTCQPTWSDVKCRKGPVFGEKSGSNDYPGFKNWKANFPSSFKKPYLKGVAQTVMFGDTDDVYSIGTPTIEGSFNISKPAA